MSATSERNGPRFANELASLALERTKDLSQRSITVTWLNHFSAATCLNDPRASQALSKMDIVGIDGMALDIILRGGVRTSADTVVPALLPLLPNTRVAVVGASRESLDKATKEMSSMLQDESKIVSTIDGYEGLKELRANYQSWLSSARPDLIILGLGPALQEIVAAEIQCESIGVMVVTCGGFLDQVWQVPYYPSWAYSFRLNWLIRLIQEPRRLWRRYSVDLLSAILNAKKLRYGVEALPGYQKHKEMIAG